MSPLYPGQWKNFLTVYAGFYVVSNFLRPFRLTLAVMVGPYFERLVNWIQRKTRLPKAGAVTVTVLLVNLGGTILLMVGGISLASFFSGVPVFAPKA
jgi:predicted PurR-regulated permease PerM